MNYFFVFQSKSYRYEYKGEYLWAPKVGSDGHTKSHWKAMEKIKRGDIIFSCVDQHIKAVAYAKDSYNEVERPDGLNKEL